MFKRPVGFGAKRLASTSLLLLIFATGCRSTLRISRGVPPQADLGPNRVLALIVRTNVGDQTANAVFSALAGHLAVPADVEPNLREKVVNRLTNDVGIQVCAPAPCGAGTLELVLTESSLGLEKGRAVGKISTRVFLTINGQITYQDTIWSRQRDVIEAAPVLLDRASDAVAQLLATAFMPSRVTVKMTVEDDGPLSAGADRLLSGNLEGAENLFNEVVAQDPRNAGAYYDLGLIAEVRGDFARAAMLHRQAAALNGKRRYEAAAQSAERDAARFAPR